MILEMQDYWNSPPKKTLKAVTEKFQVSKRTARKYVDMTKEEIQRLDMPHDYKKKDSPMNGWLNVIYKMMQDGHCNEVIYFYIRRQPDFSGSDGSLVRCIYLIGKNNFSGRSEFHPKQLMEQTLPPGVACFKRTEILKYLLTCNPKIKKNEEPGKYMDAIKEKYPIAAWVESTFKEFHGILMGYETNKIDVFIETYGESKIKSFCNGIKQDIAPVKNAISHPESSGFVEGNNNKFKLIKRIVYGRSGLVNLAKKCKLAFLPQNEEFSLIDLV